MPAMARRQRRTGFEFPDVPRDADVISAEDLSVYASALERNGFFGPTSWYMNHETNAAYGRKASNDGYLDMPVLFIHARYDYVCETVHSRLAEPMRKFCRNLSEEIIRAALAPAGIKIEVLEPILPTMEDVFVSLIEREERAA